LNATFALVAVVIFSEIKAVKKKSIAGLVIFKKTQPAMQTLEQTWGAMAMAGAAAFIWRWMRMSQLQ